MKFIYSLCLTLLPFYVFSQAYTPGRIVKTNGEILTGFVNYVEDDATPTYVLFKEVKSAEGQTYQANQLKSFQADGRERFISYSGHISMDKNEFPDVSSSLDTTTALETVFLKEIYQGERVGLLLQKDKLKSRYFIAKAGETPQELKFYYYNFGFNESRKNAIYKGQLVLLNDQLNNANKYLTQKIQESEFDKDGLKSIVTLVDKGINKENSYTSNFFIGAAIASNKLKFDGQTPLNQSSTTVSMPKINLGFNFRRNSTNAILRYRLELEAWASSPKFSNMDPDDVNNAASGINKAPTEIHYGFNQKAIAFTPQIDLDIFKRKNFQAYLGGGISSTFMSYSKSHTDAEDIQELYTFKKFVIGVPAEAGITINNKFDFVVSYTATQLYTDYVYLSMKGTTLQLSFHYNIF